MRLVCVAHPVSGDVPANLARARRWIAWLYQHTRGYGFVADWILRAEALGPESDEGVWELCIELVHRCNCIVLVGGRISDGMERERTCAVALGLEVLDLTWMGEEPPTPVVLPATGKGR